MTHAIREGEEVGLTRHPRSIAIMLIVLGVAGCSPSPSSSPSTRLSDEAIAELEKVRMRFEDIESPDLDDPASIDRSEAQLWNAKVELVRWTITHEAQGSMWGTACQTDC
jgi:hypothetical protein